MAQKFSITLESNGNAAFADHPVEEVVRALRHTAQVLQEQSHPADGFRIYDLNGNKCGQVVIEEEEEDATPASEPEPVPPVYTAQAIREQMETRAGRQRPARLELNGEWLEVKYSGLKWYHSWGNAQGETDRTLITEEFDAHLRRMLKMEG